PRPRRIRGPARARADRRSYGLSTATSVLRLRSVVAGPALLVGLHVVDVEGILLADVELPPRHHEVGPARLLDVRDRERPLLLVARRRGLDERHHAVLVAEVEVPVSVQDGSGARSGHFRPFAAPDDLAGGELDADGVAAVVAVPRV